MWKIGSARRLRGQGLAFLAAIFALGLPGSTSAQDCGIEAIASIADPSELRRKVERSLVCLESRIEALQSRNAALTRELERFAEDLSQATTSYHNENGSVDRTDRQVGAATYVLSGDRQGRPTSLEIDQALTFEICGDPDGCLVSLGLKGVVVGEDEVEAMFVRGPCALHLDRDEGTWAVSGFCSTVDLPPTLPAAEAAGRPAWGRDGDARPRGGAELDGRVMMSFGGACFLAEAAPDWRGAPPSDARLQRDTNRDLFLVAAGSGWNLNGNFPQDLLPLGLNAPLFHCVLMLRD